MCCFKGMLKETPEEKTQQIETYMSTRGNFLLVHYKNQWNYIYQSFGMNLERLDFC